MCLGVSMKVGQGERLVQRARNVIELWRTVGEV